MSIENAARKFALKQYKNKKETRDGIKGANYYQDSRDPNGIKRQYVCDGYVAACYQHPIQDIVEADPECAIHMDAIIHRPRGANMDQIDYFPTIKELKEVAAMARAMKIDKGKAAVRLCSGQFFSLKYLIEALELVGFENDWSRDSVEIEDSINGILYLHRDDPKFGEIDGLVMPIRANRIQQDYVLKDYTKEAS